MENIKRVVALGLILAIVCAGISIGVYKFWNKVHHNAVVTYELDKVEKDRKAQADQAIKAYLAYIGQECGYGIPQIAQCISFRNEVINNQKKALGMGL